MDDGRGIIILAVLFSQAATFVAVVTIIAHHLFSFVRNMHGELGEPIKAMKSFRCFINWTYVYLADRDLAEFRFY